MCVVLGACTSPLMLPVTTEFVRICIYDIYIYIHTYTQCGTVAGTCTSQLMLPITTEFVRMNNEIALVQRFVAVCNISVLWCVAVCCSMSMAMLQCVCHV